jgi:hypothetical protein
MATMVKDMKSRLRLLANFPARYNAEKEWLALIKRTISRFARGNIAAQNQRLLLPGEQKKKHERAKKIAEQWRDRQA